MLNLKNYWPGQLWWLAEILARSKLKYPHYIRLNIQISNQDLQVARWEEMRSQRSKQDKFTALAFASSAIINNRSCVVFKVLHQSSLIRGYKARRVVVVSGRFMNMTWLTSNLSIENRNNSFDVLLWGPFCQSWLEAPSLSGQILRSISVLTEFMMETFHHLGADNDNVSLTLSMCCLTENLLDIIWFLWNINFLKSKYFYYSFLYRLLIKCQPASEPKHKCLS